MLLLLLPQLAEQRYKIGQRLTRTCSKIQRWQVNSTALTSVKEL